MPIFEYECCDCGSKFERLVSSSLSEVKCRDCSSARVERRLSVFAVSGPPHSGKPIDSGPCPCGAPRRGMCGE